MCCDMLLSKCKLYQCFMAIRLFGGTHNESSCNVMKDLRSGAQKGAHVFLIR